MKQSPMKERRQSARLAVDTGVVVLLGNGLNSASCLQNISKSGLSFRTYQPISGSTSDIKLNILLIGKEGYKDLFMTNVKSKVVSQQSCPKEEARKQFGVQFTNLTPWQQNQLTNFFRD